MGWSVGTGISTSLTTVIFFFLYLATICCTIPNSLNIKLFPHTHAPVIRKAGCFILSVTPFYSSFVFCFSFNQFLPLFSAFSQHYSDASWVMINTIMLLIFGRIKIHIACSRENCFVNPIFILGRSIHDVRLGEVEAQK